MNYNSQVQRQTQGLRINPQQIQFLNFLYYNQIELEQNIQQELLENPFLESNSKEQINSEESKNNERENDSLGSAEDLNLGDIYNQGEIDSFSYKTRQKQSSEENDWQSRKFNNRTVKASSHEDFVEQLNFLTNDQEIQKIGEFIINYADNRGFLNADLDAITDDLSFSTSKMYNPDKVLKVKELINGIEPYGFASFDIQDYLLIQLKYNHKGPKVIREKAVELIKDHFNLLANRDFDKIESTLGFDKEVILEITKLIQSYPPSATFGNEDEQDVNFSIIPDYEVLLVEGKPFGKLLKKSAFNLNLNTKYANEVQGSKDKKTRAYAKEKIKSAMWYMDAIEQREHTMTKTIEAIVYLQKDYFITGETKDLRPMVLKDIAGLVDMTVSTISRVTSNKYAQTPVGLVNLKDLFSEAIELDNGSTVSNREIQEKVYELIENENKENPLSDIDIVRLLKNEGIELQRRTITKYRLAKNIPSSQKRKEIVI